MNERIVQRITIESMLTTTDNPYDPFTQFDQWFAQDMALGYHTLQYLADMVYTSDELSEADKLQAQESGIDEILKYNVNGKYKRVSREIPNSALLFE